MKCEIVREAVRALVFDLLDEAERREVEAHLESCPDCRAAFDRASRERDLLKQWAAPEPPPGLAARAISRVSAMQSGVKAAAGRRVEPEVRWLGSRTFWRIAAGIVVVALLGLGANTWRVFARRASPARAFLYGETQLTPGFRSGFRVFVGDGRRQEPIAGAKVHVWLVSTAGVRISLAAAATDRNGLMSADALIPADLPEGGYQVKVEAATDEGESDVARNVEVKRSFRTMISTDKPVYQPGQTIRIRTLTLANADLRPVSDRDVLIEVRDPKGNKVFKKRERPSDFGIASADFELADQVNIGDYTLSATVGDTSRAVPGALSVSERSVNVSRYALPKFRIDVATDRTWYMPGDKLSADLKAEYTFGKPVAGAAVRVNAQEFLEEFRTFATVEGQTDAEGRYHFELPLQAFFAGQDLKKGDAIAKLEVTVTDNAGHVLTKTVDLTVTDRPIRIELFPEGGELVQNVENILYIVTAYPDGRPAKTRLSIGSDRQTVETSDAGIAKVKITPDRRDLQLTVEAQDARGVRAAVARQLRVGEREDGFLLRTDHAVYRTGETANVEVISAVKTARVFLDFVQDRRTVLMKALDVQNGRGALAFDLPHELAGTLELHAYRIMPDGNIVRDTRVIQVARSEDLKVGVELDKPTYRPGERALLKFLVQQPDGAPAQAALSLAGVDEAVFALSDMRPGLEEVYFMLQEEILKPRYEIHAHAPVSPADLVDPAPRPDLEEAKVVLFSAASSGEGPQCDMDQSYAVKEQRIAEEKSEYLDNLGVAAALAPVGLFVLCVLPIFGYAVVRLFRREPLAPVAEGAPAKVAMAPLSRFWRRMFVISLLIAVEIVVLQIWMENYTLSALDILPWACALLCLGIAGVWLKPRLADMAACGAALPVFDKEMKRLVACWVVGIYILPLAMVFLVFEVPLPFAAAFALVVFILLIVASIRARAALPGEAAPFLRKVLAILPWAYLCAAAGAMLLIAFRGKRLAGMDDEMVVFILLAEMVIALLVVGALSIARNAHLRRVSVAQWFWLAVSRSLCAALPFIIFSFVLPAFVGAREKANRASVMARLQAIGQWPAAGGKPTPPALVRRYFPETLFWQPELITDAAGRAQLQVPLADSITTWRIAMSAVSRTGHLAADTHPLRVFQDFFVDIDFPVALTQNDEVSVPVSVFNYLDKPQTVRLEVEPQAWFELMDSPTQEIAIPAKEVKGVALRLRALSAGRHSLTVKAFGSEMSDAVEREVFVSPDGRAVVQTINESLSGSLAREIVIPDDAIDGANDLLVKIYPGAFSQVVEGMDSIFQMPYGCFEQTSSITYPNILVLDYMRRTKQIKPDIEMKALNYINLGCQRLLSYEVKGGGFEWFGHAPAHVILTAYGLMEFADMAKVYDVDRAVIERTRGWLLSKQDGDGSWTSQGGIEEDAINNQQRSKLRTTAYVAWALAETGEREPGLERAMEYLGTQVKGEKDPYTLALCANAFIAAGRASEAGEVLARLADMKIADKDMVHWTSGGEGATYSRGNALDIETTALTAYAMLKSHAQIETAHKALAWLIRQKDPRGTWYSTQATVYTMRALLAGADAGGGSVVALDIAVSVNGRRAPDVKITPDTSDVFRLISLKEFAQKGRNVVTLEPSGKGSMACQIVATHYVPWAGTGWAPKVAEPLEIAVQYDAASVQHDETLGCRVTLRYNRPGTAHMTIVDLGIPPGFEVLTDAFDQMKEKGLIERYTLTGRQIILYFSEIPSGTPIEFKYLLKAKFPVRAKTPPSSAYQYYEPEIRAEAAPESLTIL